MPKPDLSTEQVQQLALLVAGYIAEQRETFYTSARGIGDRHKTLLQPFFPHDVFNSVKVVRGRAEDPDFYRHLPAMGICNAPRFSEMEGITFDDVIVHVAELNDELLFHELVHAVQYKHLGIDEFASHYVRGFLSGGSYEEIPLEKQAYSLEARFAAYPHRAFSVEDEVKRAVNLNLL
jgi:hypothetical protein